MSAPEFKPILLQLPALTPSLAVEVVPYGATIHRFFVQAGGRTNDILLGPEKPEQHVTQKYNGTIVGRYANRIPVGPAPVTLSKNGFTSSFSPKANEGTTVSLHGGVVGFDSVAWTPLADLSESKLFTPAEIATIKADMPTAVILERVSPDGEQGFPGTLRVEFLTGLVAPPAGADKALLGSLVLVYRARLEDPNTVTPINMTQHWGFNLDASVGEPTVLQHKLDIKAHSTIALTDVGTSTGKLAPVVGTPHDHTKNATIGSNYPPTGYDGFYILSHPAPAIPGRLPTVGTPNVVKQIIETPITVPDAILEGPKSGIKLTFGSNQSGVQYYSNFYSDPAKSSRKKIHGGSGEFGDGYVPNTCAFLEFHEPLAAWQNPATLGASKDDTLLVSGELYNNYTKTDVYYHTPAQ